MRQKTDELHARVKGTLNIFLRGFYNRNRPFCMCAGFHNIWLPFRERQLKIKFMLDTIKSLYKYENPSGIRVQGPVLAFR
jgi:hypothetical protein